MAPSPIVADRTHLHLTSGNTAAGNVQRALKLLRRKEVVLHSEDAYSVGPLYDIDQGGEERARWWKGLLGKRVVLRDECWERARGSEVVLWHGPDANEHLFMLRACSKLGGTTLHEVVLPPPERGDLHARYGAVALVEPKELAAHWASLATIDERGSAGCALGTASRSSRCIDPAARRRRPTALPRIHFRRRAARVLQAPTLDQGQPRLGPGTEARPRGRWLSLLAIEADARGRHLGAARLFTSLPDARRGQAPG